MEKLIRNKSVYNLQDKLNVETETKVKSLLTLQHVKLYPISTSYLSKILNDIKYGTSNTTIILKTLIYKKASIVTQLTIINTFNPTNIYRI